MADWFIRLRFKGVATDDEAELYVRSLPRSSAFVASEAGTTEVTAYVDADSLGIAVASVFDCVYALQHTSSFDGSLIGMEAKTEQERVAELSHPRHDLDQFR